MDQLLPIRGMKKRKRAGLVVGWPPIKSSSWKIMNTTAGATSTYTGGGGGGLVGWPPIKSSRKKIPAAGGGCGEDIISRRTIGPRSVRIVRVEMEGGGETGIKKVDISLHNSYHSLLRALDCMFFPPSFDLAADGGDSDHRTACRVSRSTVVYEGSEGDDWMLVAGVPWEKFVGSVKRLKIIPANI